MTQTDMTRIWLVRHGPTHRDGLIGWTDAPADLSDTDAIARLNTHLPSDAVIVSSDLTRTMDTAATLAVGREVINPVADLREFHFGDWENRTFKDVAATDPDLSRAYWSAPGDTAPPNGESWNAGAARMSRAVDQLVTDHVGRDIIVVAHFGVILSQVQRATAMPAASVLAFKIDNLSVTCLEHMDPAWRVLGVNHLP